MNAPAVRVHEDVATAVAAELDALPVVSLEMLDLAAALQSRVDRKYVIEAVDAAAVIHSVRDISKVLEVDGRRQSWYESVYFDTPDLTSYRAAATRRPRRFKVRVRTYLDSDDRFVELKVIDRGGQTVKCRVDHRADASTLDDAARDFLAGFDLVARHLDRLEPVLTTTYRRATLLLDDDTRATIDTDLHATDGCNEITLPTKAIVETKGFVRDGSMDRVLRGLGHRRATISKYATDLAALRPELPSNRWRSTLRRHFDLPAGGGVR